MASDILADIAPPDSLVGEEIIAAVRAHAAQESPRECCGVVTVERGRRRYRPCRNLESTGFFQIHPEDWAAAEDAGEIVAVCHSHPFASPDPSAADRAMCEQTGLPWLIVNHPLGHWVEFRPSGYRAPLVGRAFVYGVHDCFAIVRDHYADLGIAIADGPRPTRDDLTGDFYRERLLERGFVTVDPGAMRENDVLLMQIAAPEPSHSAVYLGKNVILQHLEGRLSSRDVFGGWYRLQLRHVMRHRNLK